MLQHRAYPRLGGVGAGYDGDAWPIVLTTVAVGPFLVHVQVLGGLLPGNVSQYGLLGVRQKKDLDSLVPQPPQPRPEDDWSGYTLTRRQAVNGATCLPPTLS